jgi:hypothetical protein
MDATETNDGSVDGTVDVGPSDTPLTDSLPPVSACVDALVDCPAGQDCIEGECLDPCSMKAAESTGLGCQYAAVDLENGASQESGLGVLITNPSATDLLSISVHLTLGGELMPEYTLDIGPGAVQALPLPNRSVIGTLKGLYPYEVRGSRPFVAYQLSPSADAVGVGSADMTRLLPRTAASTEFVAVTGRSNGYVTVVAFEDGTEVSVRPTGPTAPGGGLTAMLPGTIYTVTLSQGELINLRGASTDVDLTGTEIWASQPVTVFAGSVLARSGGACCADHMAHQLFPTAMWGSVVVAPRSKARGVAPDYWRVVASANETTITFDPSVSVPVTLNRGEWVELSSDESFVVTGSQPIQVARILASSKEVTATGEYCTSDAQCPAGQRCFGGDSAGPGRCYDTCTVGPSDCPATVYSCHENAFSTSGVTGTGICRRNRCGPGYGPCAVGATCVEGSDLSVCFEVCQTGLTCSEPGAQCGLLVGQAVCDPPSCDDETLCPDGATCLSVDEGPSSCQWSCTPLPTCSLDSYRCLSSQLYSPETQWFDGAICVPPGCIEDADCPSAHGCDQSAGEETGTCKTLGDPSLSLLPPVEQYRANHVWMTPVGFKDNWIDIAAPTDASVLLDGEPIVPHSFVALGDAYKTVTQHVQPGFHRLEATHPVLMLAYGLDVETSYDAAGGSSLADLRPEAPGPGPGEDVVSPDAADGGDTVVPTDGVNPSVPTWKDDIRPILFTYCKDCHLLGANSGGLVLDDYAVVFQPSLMCADTTIGDAIVLKTSGDPTCEGTVMPPTGTPVTAEEIQILQAWLAAGMPEN